MDTKSKVLVRTDDFDYTTASVKKTSSQEGSEITMKQFFDFLKTAYQVTDSIETAGLGDGMLQFIDWVKLKESELLKPREIACQTIETKEIKRKSDSTLSQSNSIESVKMKLGEVLAEGIFDSVLNHMVPSQPPPSSVTVLRRPSQQKLEKSACSSASKERSLACRKSIDGVASKNQITKAHSDVIIHVCDEVKNAKKDFVCNQNLLVEKMGYFAEVTAGQRLEDMDISVHCDIGIFEWLVLWVKKNECEAGLGPELDPQCVTPILVSAAFLQMEPLIEECLLFCHEHMNEILRTSTNLSCLNDSVMTRLAAMYTNVEVEAIRDRKDKIQSRLYCKLIQSLCEPETESMRGHWNSLARVYRCERCEKLVSPSTSEEIPCIPACMSIIDKLWDINDHIEELYKTLKTWRKIYWHLWGDAHFLYCSVCKRFFQCHQIGWCRFHPDPPQFFTIDAQRASLPGGTLSLLWRTGVSFRTNRTNLQGCQFREHCPLTDTVRDSAVLSILENFRSLIEEESTKLIFPERLTRFVSKGRGDGTSENEHFWWDGIVLIPPHPKLGLLGSLGDTKAVENEAEKRSVVEVGDYDLSDCSESSSTSSRSTSSTSTESSSTPQKSDESCHSIDLKGKNNAMVKKREKQLWQYNLSARSNQDLQRSYEESTLKQMQTMLTRRTSLSMEVTPKSAVKAWPRHITPSGGVWVRLESEWRERTAMSQQQQKLRSAFATKNKMKSARFNPA
ncbi:hypothetical protein RI129_013290 [Pyrocoelia pectoralis]|uniref:SANT and BTB domain-containing protein n=1 Tax=Pyrocoelia pectoralis TaxID=417401 RepID=A0AAN7UW50_9COLE